MLRLHPPGLFGVRQAAAPVAVGGALIPAGSIVAWSPYLAGRDTTRWHAMAWGEVHMEPDSRRIHFPLHPASAGLRHPARRREGVLDECSHSVFNPERIARFRPATR